MQGLTVDIHQLDKIKQLLSENPGCELKQLTTGDYTWQSAQGLSVGIESKTATNLVGSFTTGQLADQIRRCLESFDVPILLVIGTVGRRGSKVMAETDLDSPAKSRQLAHPWFTIDRRFVDVNYNHVALANFLMSAQAAGLLLDFFSGLEPRPELEAARVRELIAFWDKAEHGSLRRKYYDPFVITPEQQELGVLKTLPGVSDVLATRLLNQFGSIYAVFHATPDELMQVEGIGKDKAMRIYKLINNAGGK